MDNNTFDPSKPYEVVPEKQDTKAPDSKDSNAEFDPNKPFDVVNEDYGSGEQMAKTLAEQGASGLTGGFSKVLETQGIPALGIKPITTPEAIEKRATTNPGTAFVGNAGGTGLLLGATGGLGALVPEAGIAARIGLGAAEAAGLGGVNQATDDWSQNKALDAQKIVANAGLGLLLGGLGSSVAEGINYKFGTPLAKEANAAIDEISKPLEGTPKPVVSELDQSKLESGDFVTALKNEGVIPEKEVPEALAGMTDLKSNAPQLAQILESNDLPVLEGIISGNKSVQRAEDALLNGAPTVAGRARQNAYQKVFDWTENTVKDALGEGTELSQAQIGNVLKTNLTKQIQAQSEPISALYNDLTESYGAIPLNENVGKSLSSEIGELRDLTLSPSSPQGAIAKRVMNEVQNLKTVDDIKYYKSQLNGSLSPTASSSERRIVGVLSDKLSDLEEKSIIDFAKNKMKTPEAKEKILGLLEQRKVADAAYKPFRTDLNTLAEKLGKRKVYGTQDAVNFINELTPEEISNKLFSKKDSEFLNFFSKKYPEEMSLLRDYQKDKLLKLATRTESYNSNAVFREVNKLEPEIQKIIFSQKELQSLKEAQIIKQNIPKNFNPSHTDDTRVFRNFFTGIPGRLLGEFRDKHLTRYIQSGGSHIGAVTGGRLQGRAVNTTDLISKGVKAIFSGYASQPRGHQ